MSKNPIPVAVYSTEVCTPKRVADFLGKKVKISTEVDDKGKGIIDKDYIVEIESIKLRYITTKSTDGFTIFFRYSAIKNIEILE